MIIILLLAWVVILYAINKYISRNSDYWKERNVPHVKPTSILRNIIDFFTLKKTFGDIFFELYKNFNNPYFGIFVLQRPHLVIKNPDIIKDILIKGFFHFSDRTVLCDEKSDALTSYMLFFSKNPEWRYIRTKVTPLFTSGKMKGMLSLIDKVGKDLASYLNDRTAKNSICDVKDICAKYATDVITSCALGIDAKCFEDQESPFRKYSNRIFDGSFKNGLYQAMYFLAPDLAKLFRFPFIDKKTRSFMRDTFWEVLKDRERSGKIRNDVIDVLIKFKRQKYLNSNFKFEGDKLLSQAAQFYLAGFESVSATMSFALYELSLQSEIQERLRIEAKNTIAVYNGINYKSIHEMTYLDMILNETLRKYPILPFLERKCCKDYKIPNYDLTVPSGISVYVSLLGLHYDPKYFFDPEKFNPERFSAKNKDDIIPFTYLPFGSGLRNCIGERFAKLSAKIGLVCIVTNFLVEPCPETPASIVFSHKSIFLTSSKTIILKLRKL